MGGLTKGVLSLNTRQPLVHCIILIQNSLLKIASGVYKNPKQHFTPLPTGFPPPSRTLPSTRPLAREGLSSPNHIWFSLGSPRMPPPEALYPRGGGQED